MSPLPLTSEQCGADSSRSVPPCPKDWALETLMQIHGRHILYALLHEQIGSKTQPNFPSVRSTRIRGPLVVAVVQKDFLPLMRVRDLADVDTSRSWIISEVPTCTQQTSTEGQGTKAKGRCTNQSKGWPKPGVHIRDLGIQVNPWNVTECIAW